MTGDPVAVVGAGLAGLACARRLRDAGREVQLFDKGRGAGGRASTRRMMVAGREIGFDHGAQYFTARDPAFDAEVARWRDLGLAAPWPAADEGAWVGVPGMSAPLRHLAADLPVAWGVRIEQVAADGAGWHLHHAAERLGPFGSLVLALPAEQAADLAAPVAPGLAALARGRPSDPCWTVLLAFDRRIAIDRDVLTCQGDLSWAARDGAKPGRTGAETWVVQASPDWSRAHLEDDADAVVAALTGLFAGKVGPLPEPLLARAHRWRFARSARGGEGCWWDGARRIGACGDWLLGPRLENAWLSGRRLADAMVA